MSRHECKGELCGICHARIDDIEYDGGGPDYSDRELDQFAEGAGRDMVHGREW